MIVFVSSPYSGNSIEDKAVNARFASKICAWVVENHPDQVPIAPHIVCSQWWNDEEHRDLAIDYCRNIMIESKILYPLR